VRAAVVREKEFEMTSCVKSAQGFVSKFRFSLPVAALIAFIPIVYFPMEIYWGNRQDFTIPFFELLTFLSIVFSVLSLLLALLMAVLWRVTGASVLVVALLLGLSFWLKGSFFNPEMGVLTGAAIQLEGVSYLTVAELSVWGLCLGLLAVYFSRKPESLLRIAPPMLVALVLKVALQPLLNSFSHDGYDTDRPQWFSSYHSEMLGFSSSGNVLHVVLDELKTEVFEEVLLRRPELKDKLQGFTLFSDVISNYPYTVMSMSRMLGGGVYQQGDNRKAYVEESVGDSPFLKAIEMAGYRKDFVTLPALCMYSRLKNCNPIPSSTRNSLAFMLIDLSIFRISPDILKPQVYNNQTWLLMRWAFNSSVIMMQPINAVPLFHEFVDGLHVQDSEPRYKLFHNLITHSPLVLNAFCEAYEQPIEGSYDHWVDQSTCALDILGKLLDKLRALGVYDNTIIVISSDHGNNHAAEESLQQLKSLGMPERNFSRSHAMLLVKPAGSSSSFVSSSVPAQLSDIPSTILSLLKLPEAGSGKDIYALDEMADRLRVYFYYDIYMNKDPNSLRSLSAYLINGPSRDPNSWSLIDVHRTLLSLSHTETIEFGRRESNRYLSVEGLSSVEPGGRWATSDAVSIEFKLASGASSDQRINLDALAYTRAGPVTAEFWLKGQLLKTVEISGHRSSYDIIVPRRLLPADGIVRIKIKVSGGGRPVDYDDNSTDMRHLSMRFISLKLQKVN
jgi:hypothetical protein